MATKAVWGTYRKEKTEKAKSGQQKSIDKPAKLWLLRAA